MHRNDATRSPLECQESLLFEHESSASDVRHFRLSSRVLARANQSEGIDPRVMGNGVSDRYSIIPRGGAISIESSAFHAGRGSA